MKKLVLITGGAQGLGKHVAENFLSKGANVIITSRKFPFIKDNTFNAHGIAQQQLDVTQEDSVYRLFEWINNLKMNLDILINNAGSGVFKPVTETSFEEWNNIVNTNLSGAFLTSREAFKLMKKKNGGRIINIGSIANKIPLINNSAYGASKSGLRTLSHIMAEEGKLNKIRVTHVNLGAVYTEIWKNREGFSKDDMLAAEEVADVLTYLAFLPLNIRIDEIDITPEKGVL